MTSTIGIGWGRTRRIDIEVPGTVNFQVEHAMIDWLVSEPIHSSWAGTESQPPMRTSLVRLSPGSAANYLISKFGFWKPLLSRLFKSIGHTVPEVAEEKLKFSG
jgi:hypothetical protein